MIAAKPLPSTSGWLLLVALLSTPYSYGADYDALPKPSNLRASIADYSLWLSLDTNGRNDGVVTQVKVRNQHYYVQSSVLKSHNVHTVSQDDWVDVNTLPQVKVLYDSLHQVLKLTVPEAWLPLQAFGGNMTASQAISSSQGLLFNYDLYSINTSHSSRYSALWLEQRYFSNSGYLSNTGTFR